MVAAQVFLAAIIVLRSGWPWEHWLTLSLVVFAAGLGTWAVVTMGRRSMNVAPQVRAGARLQTSGPYRWVRHPMYLALLLFCAGFAWLRPDAPNFVFWAMLLGVLLAKAGVEERLLMKRFPEYAEYRKRVAKLVPFIY